MLRSYLSFKKHYKEHKDFIFRYVYARVRDQDMAEDIVSDTFVKAYTAFESFSQEKDFKPWVTTIARNTLYDHYKSAKNNNEEHVGDESWWDMREDEQETIVEKLISQETWEEILYMINDLTESQQQCILGRYLHYKSDEEIALELDTSKENVRKHVSRGISSLRKKIK